MINGKTEDSVAEPPLVKKEIASSAVFLILKN